MAKLWFDSLKTILPILKLKVFLQGPYDIAGDTMTTSINNILPDTSVYSAAPDTATLPIPPNITDWVLLEIRGSNGTTVIKSKSCFLRNDGIVVDPKTYSENISLGINLGNYYIVIKHRNHLGVMSNDVVQLNGLTSYDFTTGSGQYYGTGGAKELEPGIWGMWAGDVNRDGIIKYSDLNNDRLEILIRLGFIQTTSVNGYYSEDVNMDGVVKYSDISNDRLIILNNLDFIQTSSKSTQVPN